MGACADEVKRTFRLAYNLPMQRFLLVGIAAGLLCGADFDVLIRNGRIVDGTGNPSWAGDVAVRAGKIAAMGPLGGRTAELVIDARGMVVAPGFIDIHDHSDYSLLVDGNAESMIRQGVTSLILGEGGSAWPAGGKQIEKEEQSGWKDFTGYFQRLLEHSISLNVGTYVGSSQV